MLSFTMNCSFRRKNIEKVSIKVYACSRKIAAAVTVPKDSWPSS
jgi:hypothetical protein